MKVLIVALAFFVSACAHTATSSSGAIAEHVEGHAPNEAPALYRQASGELEQGRLAEAVRDFDRFLQQFPADRYFQAALLNSGRALEGLKNWPEAASRYHQVVAGTGHRAPRLQAMALYRLSDVHEALGDDAQVIADLADLQSRKRFLPQEIAEGEMPARLAAAYARIGNFEKAQAYYRQAEVGIARLRQNETTPAWLPQTLFLMGETSRTKLSWTDFETFIRPFARSQIYLLQSAELGQSPWSDKAAGELVQVYNDMISTLLTAQPAADVVAQRALQKKRWERVGLVIECLADLRARMLPETAKVPQIAKIKTALKRVDAKITEILEERPAGEGLTPSAIARRKARRLKTEATTDSLEQAFLKSSRENKPALVPKPPPEVMTTLPGPDADEEPIRPAPAPIRSVPVPSTSEDPNL